MTDDEPREFIAGQNEILASLEGKPKHENLIFGFAPGINHARVEVKPAGHGIPITAGLEVRGDQAICYCGFGFGLLLTPIRKSIWCAFMRRGSAGSDPG